MSTIVTRTGKGASLTWIEADANFTNLNTDKLEAGFSSSMVEYLPAGVGTVSTTVQTKLRESVSSADFPDLATAISSIGSAKTHLLVNSPVTVMTDLIIPSNISLTVCGLGLITIVSGKRLYINGPFSAPKMHQCFNAPLLTTAITASVSGLTLVVTAVSNPVLVSGQVVTGGGLGEGVTIAQGFTGGVGTYTLNGDWGTIASTSFTVTGASVIFGAGVVEHVYPQWFGALPDAGVTDNTEAIRHSVYSQVWGGKVKLSAGNYKVTGSTVLHGGISIEGDGVADTNTGSPPANETTVPSYVWQATDNTAIWVIPVRADHINIRNLSHGASATQTGVTPVGTNRIGILFNGHAPQFVFAPTIENCYFFHLTCGVSINDALAGSNTNWGVNPGLVRNCQFVYCQYGILIYTDNADAWKIDQCVFILAANSSGVHLLRCGFLKLDSCFAFGANYTNSEFINIAPFETLNPIDTVTIDNCQAEACSHFLTYAGTNTRSFDINLRSCILQDGADIYLGNLCSFNGIHNHYMAFVYYNAPDIRITSVNDWFEYQNFVSGATWSFSNVGGGDVDSITTYIPGHYPSSFIAGPILNRVSVFGEAAAGTPVGVVTPRIVGQEFLDTTVNKWYKSNGLTNTSWLILN